MTRTLYALTLLALALLMHRGWFDTPWAADALREARELAQAEQRAGR